MRNWAALGGKGTERKHCYYYHYYYLLLFNFLKGKEGTLCAGRVMYYMACGKKVVLEKLLTRVRVRKETRKTMKPCKPA